MSHPGPSCTSIGFLITIVMIDWRLFTMLHIYIYIVHSILSLSFAATYIWKRDKCNRSLRSNQNPYIEEEQKTEKVQKDKQRYTNNTYKTKDRVTLTPLKTGGERRCSGSVNSPCSTIDTRRVNLVTNPVI